MRRARKLSLALGLGLAAGAGCGVFELGDVIPLVDAGADGARADTEDGGCVSDGDPCACLPAPTTISPPPRGVGDAIAVSGAQVFFMVSNDGSGSGDALYSVPSDGSAPAKRVMVSTPGATPPIVFGGGFVFMRKIGTNVGVYRVSASGADQTATLIVGGLPLPPLDLTADAQRLYWPNNSAAVCTASFTGPSGGAATTDAGCPTAPFAPPRAGGAGGGAEITISATSVFWTNGSRLYRAPVDDGAAASVIASRTGGNASVVGAVGPRAFWIFLPSSDAGTLFSTLEDGGDERDVVPTLIPGHVTPHVAVDSDTVAWTDRNFPRVQAADVDGAHLRVLACQPSVVDVATDATFVYWVTNEGAVQRVPKR